VPYNVGLVKKGFKEVASTKSIESIIVIDALCSTNELLRDDKARLLALKRSIDESIEMIQKDPLTSYKVVKKYLSDISYREYIEALNAIKWINKPSKELLDFIKDLNYSEETIIK
jgi:NitT/TauT family transport system substrate-binding protein